MKSAPTFLAALLLAGAAQAQPRLPGPNFPAYRDAADVQTRCDSGLQGAKR